MRESANRNVLGEVAWNFCATCADSVSFSFYSNDGNFIRFFGKCLHRSQKRWTLKLIKYELNQPIRVIRLFIF